MAAYITIFLAVISFANAFGVRIYGHIEYIMSFMKCLVIFAVIFFMFIMTSGGIPATNGPIEFRYWKNPGAFNNGMKGFSQAFVQALFSFGGGELTTSYCQNCSNSQGTRRAHCYHCRRGHRAEEDSPQGSQTDLLANGRFLCGEHLARRDVCTV